MTELAKVGDKVVCIDDQGSSLTRSKVYDVVGYNSCGEVLTDYYLKGVAVSYRTDRFAVVKPSVKEKYIISFDQEFDSIEEAEEFLKQDLDGLYLSETGARIGKVVVSYDVEQSLTLRKI